MAAPGLFDYINMMFKTPVRFTSLSTYEKSKSFFMMNRFFAIKYPIQAQMFNRLTMNTGEAVQYWCDSLSKIYNTTPGWIFNALKSVKTTKKENKEKVNISDETIRYYCKINQCAIKDVEYAISVLGDEMVNELKTIEKMMKQ
jgi:hypothetical protein